MLGAMDDSASHDLRIIRFAPQWQQAARMLILDGLKEHWGVLDPTKNSDIEDIEASFAAGIFLLALRGTQLVAAGGLLPERDGVMRVVRMSVTRQQRKQGIGGLILQALLKHAEQLGCRDVVCETTQTWQDAIQFYLTHGFTVTHQSDGNIHFTLRLPPPPGAL